MAKKASSSSSRKGRPKSATRSEATEGMTDLRIRIDSRVHQKIKEFAERSEISINQLVCGVLEANIEKMHLGEAELDRNGIVVTSSSPKCVYVGEPGGYFTEEDEASGLIDELNERFGTNAKEGDIRAKGELWFTLDYSGRPIRYGRRS